MAQGILDTTFDPNTIGLLSLASGLLQAGGPQRTPVSFGQALGMGLDRGIQGYQGARDSLLKNQLMQEQLTGAKLGNALAQGKVNFFTGATPALAGPAPALVPDGNPMVPGPNSSIMAGAQGTTPAAGAAPTSTQPILAQQPQQGGFPSVPGLSPEMSRAAALGWLAPDYVNAVAGANKPISTRYGIFAPDPNNPGRFTPVGGALPQNAMPYQIGPNGQVDVRPYPGQVPGVAALAAAQSGGSAYGKLPLETQVVQTPGAPTLMTGSQAVQYATGTPPPAPGVPAAGVAPSAAQPLRMGGRLQDQGQNESQKKYGAGIGEQGVKVVTNAADAVPVIAGLQQIRNYAQGFTPGRFAPLKQAVGETFIGLGVSPETVTKQLGSVSDMQGLASIAIQMAGKATRQSDAQPSQLQFLKTLESMPSSSRTPEGLVKIVDYMTDVKRMDIDKLHAQQAWLASHNGDIDGFENAWIKQAQTMPYIWNRMASAGAAIKEAPSSGGWSIRPVR